MVFFEARKKQDLYVWLAKAPEGPSVKFLALNGISLCSCPMTGNKGRCNWWGINHAILTWSVSCLKGLM